MRNAATNQQYALRTQCVEGESRGGGCAKCRRGKREVRNQLDGKLGNQQNGCMKTTIDLPDALVKQVKLRALQDGRKLKDAVADLLRKGLIGAADTEPDLEAPVVGKDKQTGLPLIQCKKAASPQEELTPRCVADILLTQESDWHHAVGR
jgi:plasmid stability protein